MKNKCIKCGKQKSDMKQIKVDKQVYLCDACSDAWYSVRDKAVAELFIKWTQLK